MSIEREQRMLNEDQIMNSFFKNTHINFHFDSHEKIFPADSRLNQMAFMFTKYNHLSDKKPKKHSPEEREFMSMMAGFKERFAEHLYGAVSSIGCG